MRHVTQNRFGVIVSALQAVKALQLPAVMTYYGPVATAAWAVVQVIRAIRRRLPPPDSRGSDHEQLDLVAIHSRGDLR